MEWLFIALLANLLIAIVSVVDKYLLGKQIPNPAAYTFYVGIFSIFAVVFVPFGIDWPGTLQFLLALSVGVVHLIALFALFSALKTDEVSRITALVGGATPVFLLILSAIFLDTPLGRSEMTAFILLIIGGVLISFKKGTRCRLLDFGKYSCGRNTWIALASAVLFAVFFLLADFVFSSQQFISGFVWTRMGSLLMALVFLAMPSYRKMISGTTEKVSPRAGELFIFNKALAGVGFILLNYAISLGNVALVNALEGVKFVFVLLIAVFIARKIPVLDEEISIFAILQKTAAIFIIFAGIFILAFY